MPRQQIQGHDSQRRAFARAVQTGRLAHAYLFVGPSGIGKRLFAADLAKALLCDRPTAELAPCDRCESCTLVDAATHPDYYTVARPEAKNELPIDEIRNLCEALALKPARGHRKIVVLDDVDDFNQESANSFLKTLEEPPPCTHFFLIGTTVERQLPTIVSRCQVVRFAPLADEAVAAILQQQGISDPGLLACAVHLGHGSPAQALALADPELWQFRKELIGGLAQPRPNAVELAAKLMDFVARAGKEKAAQRRRAGDILRLLIEFFSDALAKGLGASRRFGDPQELPLLGKLADRVGPEKLLRVLDRCLEADSQNERYIQVELGLEGLFDALGAALK